MMITGAEVLARTLVGLDARYAFNVPGFGLQPLVEALDAHRDELRYVSSVNETNIALIAAGYARVSGRPAFVDVYHSSGTALAMMAITTAWGDNAPLVVASTTAARSVSGRDTYAAVPRHVTDMSAGFTKWDFEVPSAERIPEVLARAFAIAATPPMGPVHIAIPLDVYTESVDESVVDIVRPLAVPQPGSADASALADAAAVIAAADDPVMVLGAEVAAYGAIDQAVALAEAAGATVLIEPFPARLPFPTAHAQYVGKVSDHADAAAAADVVLYVGSELTEQRGPWPGLLQGTGATRIVLSTDPTLVTKFFTPHIALTGAPAPTLSALADAVSDARAASGGAASAHYADRRAAAVQKRTAILEDGFDASPLRAGRVVHEVAAAVGDGILINQAGTAAVFADLLWETDAPEGFFGISAKASAQGWAVPAGIGASLARPDEAVVVLVGDGGFMFSATAIYTAANIGAHVVFVVLENGGWQDISESSRVIGGAAHERESEYGWTFRSPQIDLVGFSASLGVRAVRAASPDELRAQLRAAVDATGPTVVVVDSDPADVEFFFRK